MHGFDWTFPYPSQRMPVLSRQAVATSQPLAAQVGLSVMQRGGNAADAAVATAAALTVVEPTSNGLGSDAFAILWDGDRVHGLNASGRSPAGLDVAAMRGRGAIPQTGWDPVTVPGAVSGWVELHRRFGCLPFSSLLEGAISYARDGFHVSPMTAGHWATATGRWGHMPAFREVFLPGNNAPAPGSKVRFPLHARSLEKIALTNGESFYQGELADAIVEDAARYKAPMTHGDLADHACEWVEPLTLDYRGLTLHELPPNGQGIAALSMLGILQHTSHEKMHVDCPDAIHLQIESMKLAFADAHRHVADPAHMVIDPGSLLTPEALRERAGLIDPDHASDYSHGSPRPGGTVLLVAADADGMMVSFIQSNYMGFGSGVVIPGTGIAMQNRGCGFTLEAGHPNEIAPGKRPFHTIIPAMLTTGNGGGRKAVMVFGVMGGPMQPQGHAQVVSRFAGEGQNPQAALDAPRWRVGEGRTVEIEPGYSPDVYEVLRERGHDLTVASRRSVHFGGGQAIAVIDGGYCAASDLRRDGQAVGS